MAKPATSKSTQLNTWDAALAKSAQVAAAAEQKTGARNFASMGGGKFSMLGSDVPGGEAPVVVLDQIHTNLYYAGAYDSNNPVPPDCFAFARADESGNIVGVDTWDGSADLKPHKDSTNRQHDDCASCPHNQWNSSPTGRGKACQNARRVAMIPAGAIINGKAELVEDADKLASAPLVYLKIPTMSRSALSGWVKQLADGLSMPTWGVFGVVKRVPSANQFNIEWDTIKKIPSALLETIYKRVQEAQDDICHPFAPPSPTAPAPAKGKAKAQRKYT